VTQIADSVNGTITRSYDSLDRLTEETTPQGTVDYTYDAAGRRASMTVAGQTAVTYAYDDANRLTGLTQGSASVALSYDAADRRSTLTYPNGIVATYGYDAANQFTSLTYALGQTTLGNLTYTYDPAGRRTAVGGTWARTGIPPALASATYDAANRITTWGGTVFSYDPNGNLTSDGLTSYSWNARNQLVGLSGGASASFQYDGLLRRRGKTVGGTGTIFLYDGLNLLQELSGSTPTANLLTGLSLDETFTRTDASGTSTFLVDVLGSTLALADAGGTVQTQYTYEPFGAPIVTGAMSSNTLQFIGRENDKASLFYYRARYYHSSLQRFLSEDPIGFAGGQINLHSYVANQPLDLKDPRGTSLPWVHYNETLNAALSAGWSYWDAVKLALAVIAVDRDQGTGPASAHKHAMSGRKEPCQTGYENILNQFDSWDLATRLHAIEDSYAKGHQYQPWPGVPSPSHIAGDLVYISEAEGAAYAYLTSTGPGGTKGFFASKPSNCQ